MILADRQIQTALDSMFDLYRSKGVTPKDLLTQINPNSIDLTIGKSYKRPNRVSLPVEYGFGSADEGEMYGTAYWTDFEAEDGFIEMKPGDIILGHTREYVTMPEAMCGQIFTKSTLGRMFINHMMAGVVDAGFHGVLTLELHNAGVHTIRIPVGARVVQLICYKLDVTPDRPYGAYGRGSRYMEAGTVESAKWRKAR